MFCTPGLIFYAAKSSFHVLRSLTLFQRYRGRQVRFSYFALPNSFSAVSRVSGSFSCFTLPDSLWSVPRASGPVFMFWARGLIFGCTEGVGSFFHVLRSRTRFGWYRGCRVPFSCFVLPDSFSTVLRMSGPVCLFCAPKLVFDSIKGVRSCFNVLHSRIRFGRYRGRRVTFQYFVLSDLFWAVPRASGPDFMFCAPELIWSNTEGVGSCFSCVALPDSFSMVPRASGPIFMFCALGLIFGGTKDVGSRLHVLHSWTHFRRYRGRLVPFSCFTLPDSFGAVPRASGHVFIFCGPGPLLGGTEVVGSNFHVLCSHTYLGRDRGRRVPFSCFVLHDSFSTVLRTLGPVCMFCAPGLVFDDTEDAGSRYHVLRSLTHFRRYRGCPVSFACFALPYTFTTVPRHWVSFSYFAVPDLF
jgi:hypothetical protein